MQLDNTVIASCKHPRLGSRFALALVCTILLLPVIGLLLALGVVSLLLFMIVFLLWLGGEVAYARTIDNVVKVSDLNYPRIHQLAEEVRAALGVRREIAIFVYEEGNFNATLIRFFRRRAIFLQSELLQSGVTDNEVRWIVGRFIGYLRLKQDRGIIDKLISITERSGIFTLLILPYRRAMVYTGDRLGLAAIDGDVAAAASAMQKLLVGRELGYSVNPLGIIAQRRETKGSVFAFLGRVGMAFPATTARYVDLLAFARVAYGEQFARFEAGTPGIPADLDQLSGERTSSSSVMTAVGLFLLVGVVIAGIIWTLLSLPLTMALGLLGNAGFTQDPLAQDYAPAEPAALGDGGAIPTEDQSADAAAQAAAAAEAAADEIAFGGPVSYNFCIDNNTDYALNYETAPYPGAGWTSYTLQPGQGVAHAFAAGDNPQIRLDITLGDTLKTQQYTLTPGEAYSNADCGGALYQLVYTGSVVEVRTGF